MIKQGFAIIGVVHQLNGDFQLTLHWDQGSFYSGSFGATI